MREYLILTATFTAPFALLGLLNVLPDLSLRNIVSRVFTHHTHHTHHTHVRAVRTTNPITLSERR